MTIEEKKKAQLEAQRRYRAKKGTCYTEAQKQAIYKYLNRKRQEGGKQPIKPKVKEIILDFEI